jgi:hypothetical protein
MIDSIERESKGIFEQARGRWPVGKTKKYRPFHSIERLDHDLIVSSDFEKVRGRVTNDAPWAPYIRPNNLYGASAFVELLQKPAREAKNRLAGELVKQAKAGLSG